MKCPECGKPSEVVDSRPRPDHIWRRRKCFNEHKFTTKEYATGTEPSNLHEDVREAVAGLFKSARALARRAGVKQ